MPTTDPLETKNKILSIIRLKGPCLPVHIASQTKISSIFAGAFLSELANEDAIKISNIKVGGSPLYYIKGQENMLDSYYKYFPEKEREAFLSLKQNRILEDRKQEPAIRVALRSIKDFAVPFKKDEDIFWRFHSTTEQEVRNILEPKLEETKVEVKEKVEEIIPKKNEEIKIEIKEEKKIIEKPEIEINLKKLEIEKPIEVIEKKEKLEDKFEVPKALIKKEKHLDIGFKHGNRVRAIPPDANGLFQNPLVIQEAPKKEKPKSEFVLEIIEKINKKYKIIEEKYYKPREYSCIVQVNSDLGPINFLAFVSDKKKISETEVKKMLSDSQKIPLPTLVLYEGEVSKKAIDLSKAYFSVLKIEKI